MQFTQARHHWRPRPALLRRPAPRRRRLPEPADGDRGRRGGPAGHHREAASPTGRTSEIEIEFRPVRRAPGRREDGAGLGGGARWPRRSTISTASTGSSRAFLKGMADLQLLGICIPEAYGGAGMDYVSLGLASEELEYVDTHLRVIMSVHVGLNCMTLWCWGTEEQKTQVSRAPGQGREDRDLRPHRAERRAATRWGSRPRRSRRATATS